MTRALSTLLDEVKTIQRIGALDPQIETLAYDSRDVSPGSLFFALPGIHSDGHTFIHEAVSSGALAIVHSSPLEKTKAGVVYLRVNDSRRAMSPISAAFYGHPSRKLRVIGVTGTDGKTTTCYFIQQLLEFLGKKSGLVSTVYHKIGSSYEKNPLKTGTPEAPEIHRILNEMLEVGEEYAVVEATSHGLSEKNNRLGDLAFDAAVLTNITHEHIEFHGSFESYRYDKANLFRALDRSGSKDVFGVVNAGDPNQEYFRDATKSPVLSYGLNSDADLVATDLHETVEGINFQLNWEDGSCEASLNLPGLFNVENAMAALLATGRLVGSTIDELATLLPKLTPTPGRMQRLSKGQPFDVIVDFAHSPGAFEKVLPEVRKKTLGRLVILFGSAGDRDLEKRPMQGEIAARYGDVIVLSDEDPRGEDPMKILEDIAAGCRREKPDLILGEELFLIPDRRRAIQKAFDIADTDDLVMLLGKSHESSITYADRTEDWNEVLVAEGCLTLMGYG